MNSHLGDIANFSQALISTKGACIWVPSNFLVVHHLPVPTAPRRKWSELVPWMLEDKLLQTPEDMHFVLVGKSKDKLTVYVTAKNQMQEWQDSVKTLGTESFQFIPDYLALPWHSGLLSIGKRDEHVLVRYGEYEGFSTNAELAWHMIEDVLQESENPLSLSISMPIDELPEGFPEELIDKIEIKHLEIDWQQSSFPKSANLLQGEFSLAPNSYSLMSWLKTAALFVLVLILSFATLNIENNRLEDEIDYLGEQNRSAFYSLFPGLTIRAGDIRTTVETYISNRFRQRESLESEAMQTLTIMDSAMSACDCDIQGIRWSNKSLELILPQSLASVVEQLDFDGYRKQINTEPGDNIRLTLNLEYGR